MENKSSIHTECFCNICNKFYVSQNSLCNHNNKFHTCNVIDVRNNKNILQCEYCNKIFSSRSTKSEHKRKACKFKNNIINNNNIIVPVINSTLQLNNQNIDDNIKFNIKTYKNKYSITDVVLQCNLSVYPNKYISKIKDKILYNSEYYITKTKLLSILEASKSIKGKKLLNEITLLNKYNQLNNIITNQNILESTNSYSDNIIIKDNNSFSINSDEENVIDNKK